MLNTKYSNIEVTSAWSRSFDLLSMARQINQLASFGLLCLGVNAPLDIISNIGVFTRLSAIDKRLSHG